LRLDAALARLRATLAPVAGLERVPLAAALGRTLAETPTAAVAVPPFDSAAMDGWAVRAADLGRGPLPVGGRIAAGHPAALPLRVGHAYRIFTGAPVPAGLDCVIRQEDAHESDGGLLLPPCGAGANIRRAGEAVAMGDQPLAAGTILRPPHLGVAASIGLAELVVRRRLRVAVFSSGDELHDPGQPLPPAGQYDANRTTLGAALRAMGCAVADLGILPDRLDVLTEALGGAAAAADLIVTSGGVSVGEEDHVKPAIRALGHLDLWRLALKPGKPLAVGRIGATPILGLPGNPVAALVTFLLVGREVVAALGGAILPPARRYRVAASFALSKPAGRRDLRRASLDARGAAVLYPSDSSGVLVSVIGSEGFVDLGEAVETVRPGDPVDFLPLSELMP